MTELYDDDKQLEEHKQNKNACERPCRAEV
jgi:hypothetical protein